MKGISAFGSAMATFSEHVENIKSCGVWGTKMELQSASNFFGIPVYTGMLNSRGYIVSHSQTAIFSFCIAMVGKKDPI